MRRLIRPLLLLLPLFLAGCGGPPPEPELDRLYRALADRPDDRARTCLRGKRIVIDPGHGGAFPGAVGAGGLAEKDANLGVALYLWGLLTEAGAEARLTRAADRDFRGGAAETPAPEEDLAARIAFADSLNPHLFLSIHHNAAADTNRSRNRVETYYREGDEASLDAARRIHASLLRNLGIDEDGAVRPGNYAVLRNARWPAVLGEPSYLSHPPVEEKLALAEKQRLEAEAYFLGMVDHFRRGVPEGRIDAPPERVRGAADLRFEGILRDEPGHAGIDPSSARVLLDDRPLEIRFDPAGGKVRAPLPALLPPGEHRITLHGRNREGNAAPEVERRFLVDPPAARAVLSGLIAPGEGTVHLRARFEDRRGLSAAEGKRIALRGPGVSAEGVVRGGVLALPIRPDSLPAALLFAGPDFEIRAALGEDDLERPTAALLLLGREDAPAAGAAVWIEDRFAGSAGPEGWIGLAEAPERGETIRIEAPGLPPARETASGGAVDTVRAAGPPSPLGRSLFLLDPAGRVGDGDPPSASLLLGAARETGEILRFWGGRPSLTREGPLPAAEDRRIPLAGEKNADYWITFGAGPGWEVRHFPGSARGEPLARTVAAEMESVLGRPVPVRAATDRVLRETPCPALRILFPPAADRAVPFAIAEGIRKRLDRSPDSRPALRFPGLVAGDEVRIDDRATFRAVTDRPLRVVLPAPGRWTVRILHAGTWETREIDVPPGEDVRVE